MNKRDNRFSLEQMLKTTAEKLGTTPQALQTAAQKGDLSGILGNQNNAQSQQLKKLLSDPKEAQKFLNNPAVKKMMDQLNGNKK